MPISRSSSAGRVGLKTGLQGCCAGAESEQGLDRGTSRNGEMMEMKKGKRARLFFLCDATAVFAEGARLHGPPTRAFPPRDPLTMTDVPSTSSPSGVGHRTCPPSTHTLLVRFAPTSSTHGVCVRAASLTARGLASAVLDTVGWGGRLAPDALVSDK